MKNTLFLLVALLFAGSAFAQKAPTAKLISSNENSIVVNFQLNGFSTQKVSTPQGDQYVVNAPEMVSRLEAGAPDLPMYVIPAIIGDRAEMSINIIDAKYTDYTDMDIAPSKGNFSRQINPADVPYTYGAMYQQDAFYPATQAYLESPYIIRDFRGQNIMVTPFAYNAQTRTLRVYDNMTIEMKKVSDNGVNAKVNRKSNNIKVDPEMKQAYSRRFINFGQTRYTFTEDRGTMLVICPEQYMAAMQPLVDWKNQSGRPCTMVSVTEAGGNNNNNIKAYIQNLYDNDNLEFILFVGDYNDLTPHSMNGGCSDNWFAMLEGNDYYLEAFVGRFSVESVQDVETQVNKVLYYERDMNAEVTYADKGLGIGYIGAGSGHFGEDDYRHIDLIRDTLEHYTYSHVTEHHGGSGGTASVSSISNTINEGVSIINYCNHGSETSWGVANYNTGHVNALTNDNMLPIVWSVACLNGKFNHNQPCFAEAWLRATDNSTGVPTGAIGGMFSWISQPWIPPMYGQDEMVDIITEWHSADLFNHTLGGASLNGDEYILDAAPEDGGDTHNTWILFGDPSLLVRTTNPVSMNVTASPAVLLIGMNELNVEAETEFGIATLSRVNMEGNLEVISSSYIENGTVTLEFDPLDFVGNLTLTVIGYNKVTEVMTVEVVPAEGPYLVLNSYKVAGEGQLNYGEDATVDISVKNVGVEAVSEVIVTMTCESEYVEIHENTTTIANINANEVIELNDFFRLSIANDVPNGEKVEFNVDYEGGGRSWNSHFMLTLNAPIIEIANVESNNVLAGETGTLSLTFVNNGGSDAPAGTVNIFSSSTDITFEATAIEVEALAVGETVTVEFSYTIAEGVEEGSCYEISYIYNAGHYSYANTTAISVGDVMDGFETGDFTVFDWNWSGANWTIDANNAYEGNYSARSGVISHYGNTDMMVTVEIPSAGEISFFKKVSSETNYDKLHFYLDGNEMGTWSGEIDWSQETYSVTAGTHTLKWSYTKDVSVSSGSDCAWIDNVTLPATSVITSLAAVEGLVANVNENEISLEWNAVEDATNYIIYRNGEEIANQADVIFTETLEDGVYTYCVIAQDAEGHLSQPAYATVNVGIVGVAENNVTVNIYPNPASSMLTIDVNADYEYVMYNNMGQQVMAGSANGQQQLNVNDFAQGVYVLRITTGSDVQIHKILVK